MARVFASACTILAVAAAVSERSSYMDCGDGVALCGVLTLESGEGEGNYHHDKAGVHGLWPEVGSYGSSKCIPPQSWTDPSQVFRCYEQDGTSNESLIGFETHEWEKHGSCAGVEDVTDFFGQICDLAEAPTKVMESSRQSGRDIDGMAHDLSDSGYAVWSTDKENSQVLLSACADSDGRWVLADVEDFEEKCGDDKNKSKRLHNLGIVV